MPQNVLITGTGRPYALGYALVEAYLKAGHTVLATVRQPSPALDALQRQYPGRLYPLTMDIGSTASVDAAYQKAARAVDHLDLIINNAVTVSRDVDKGFFDADLDLIAHTVDVTAVGAMRVIRAFLPLLRRSAGTALIINISSEAGSISRCYRTNLLDYGMAKAALNMATMNLYNTLREEGKVNIFCIHPGWIRTDGKADNPAPLSTQEAAAILMELFEVKRADFTCHRFLTNTGEEYPF